MNTKTIRALFKNKKYKGCQVDDFCVTLSARGREIHQFHPPVFSRIKSASTCRVCSNTRGNENLLVKEMFLGSRHTFQYVLCKKCGSLSIKDIPVNIKEYYRRYYTEGAPPHPQRPSYVNLAKRVILHPLLSKPLGSLAASLLKTQDDFPIKALANCHILKNDRILDVGCGSGSLIKEMSVLGYKNVKGIDPYASNQALIENSKISTESLQDLDGKFSVIMFHHSMEHMEDLGMVFSQVNRLLEMNGKCLIRIPNINSYGFRKFKENWSSIHAPFHNILPSKKAMNLLSNKHGFKIVLTYGEQLPEFLLYSQNYKMNIADFDTGGLRRFLGYQSLGRQSPPNYNKRELKIWRKKFSKIRGTLDSDWICCLLVKTN